MATITADPPTVERRDTRLVRLIREEVIALHPPHADSLICLLAYIKLDGPATRPALELAIPEADYRKHLATASELLKTDADFSRRFFHLNHRLHL